MTSRYFWPSMNTDVARWTRTCLGCQRSKITRHTITPLGQFQDAGRFDHIHVDIVGPLLPSEENQYIVTMIDRRTKWPEAVPVRNITAETIARAVYEHWICRFGCPLRITTDQGRQFESTLFKTLMTRLGVDRLRTSSYHPQSNGQVERWHRTLKAALMARGTTNNWTQEIHTVLFGLRASLHKNTDLSPALLTYGATLRLPGDFFTPTKTKENEQEFVKRLTETMASLAPNEQRHRQNRTPFIHKDLATCTYVFLRDDAVRKPLTPPYQGPYKVIERQEKCYKIQLPNRTTVVSMDRLKPAYLYEEFSTQNEPTTIEEPAPADPEPVPTSQQKQAYVTRYGRVVHRKVRFT